MKKRQLRALFVLLALVLLVPLGLLVRSAFEGVRLERDFRHRIVAQGMIAEMERELTAFLAQEEVRPYEHYRYFYVRPGAFELEVSPLAELPAERFVLGHFQVEPDGGITSPHVPRDPEQAASRSGWVARAEVEERVREMARSLVGFWDSDSELRDQSPDSSDDEYGGQEPPPGSTVEITKHKKSELPTGGGRSDRELQSKEAAPFRVLENLSSGAELRQERLAKVQSSDASNVYNFSQSAENNAILQRSSAGSGQDLEAAESDELGAAIEEVLQTRANATIEVRQEPMVSRTSDNGRLVLYRTVLVGGQAYRQGLVLDQRELIGWLTERVLSVPEVTTTLALSEATSMASSDLGGDTLDSSYSFLHRFAEPFGSVSATLTLSNLPATRAASTLFLLSAIVALASTVGLFALYRAVEVSLSYAERRNNFVSAVTHELKTPLTAIRMYGEMLRDGLVGDAGKRQRYYQLVTAESERLSRLLDNVLELSRLENGRRQSSSAVGDPSAVIREAVDVLRPHASSEGYRLEVDIEDDLPDTRFDRDGLKQVIFNLVDNAMKYSGGGDALEIEIRCRRDPNAASGDGLLISVADCGPGVAPEHLKRIFEPFYRPEDELTRQSKGTGIGLALVRGLVEEMGGRVSGRNRRSGGFEVSIQLPA